MNFSRRYRSRTLTLALIAGGVFLIFIVRVQLFGEQRPAPRTCAASTMFMNGEEFMTFNDMQRLYHFTMETLVEERMRLYEGTTFLQCTGEEMEQVIPPGQFASVIATHLPYVPDPPRFSYADFELLLLEFWRTYDCHLFAIQRMPEALDAVFKNPDALGSVSPGFSALHFLSTQNIGFERDRARRTFDRLLTVLRSSEQYLPLHASLRCLQRGATDVRNVFSLISDASQCLPQRLGDPSTSLLK
jgi:hypothetical protein